jgi:hypothetical protein
MAPAVCSSASRSSATLHAQNRRTDVSSWLRKCIRSAPVLVAQNIRMRHHSSASPRARRHHDEAPGCLFIFPEFHPGRLFQRSVQVLNRIAGSLFGSRIAARHIASEPRDAISELRDGQHSLTHSSPLSPPILFVCINGSRVRREPPIRRTGAFQTSKCESAP